MKRGPKPKYHTEAVFINGYKQTKNSSMSNTLWVCDVCHRGYGMWRKTNHLRTNNHIKEAAKVNDTSA